MRHGHWLPMFVFALPIAACEPGQARSTGHPSMLVRPNPASVSFTADSKMSVRERISAAKGGEIQAIDMTRGVLYTLTFPPDALLFDETITMTPVSRVEGLPFSGGWNGAVHLEPEGLQLAGVATLRIARFDPKTGRSIMREGRPIGFAAEGDGAELRLASARRDTSTVVHLTHFSIAGDATGTPQEVAAQLERAPTDPAAQYEQQLSVEDIAAKGKDIFRSMYYDVVEPKLRAGTASDEALAAGAAAYFGWQRQFQLVGGGDEDLTVEVEHGRKLLMEGFKAAYERLKKRCDQGDLGGIRALLTLARTVQLLGHVDADFDKLFPDYNETFEMCTAVDLVFESRIDALLKGSGDQLHDIVKATVPLEFDWSKGTLAGTAPLEYVAASGTIDGRFSGSLGQVVGGCVVRISGPARNGTFTLLGISLASNPKKDVRAALGDSISVIIDPGTPMQRLRAEQCAGIGSAAAGTVSEGEGWRASWKDSHRKEQMEWVDGAAQSVGTSESENPQLVWLISGWTPGSGGVIAQRKYDTVLDNVMIRTVERSTLEFRRRPRK